MKKMNISTAKKILDQNKNYLAKNYFVKEIGIFGSWITREQKQTSDLDILVSFEKSHKDFFNFIRLKYFLEDLLKLEVDLVMKDAIKPRLKHRILKEVKYV